MIHTIPSTTGGKPLRFWHNRQTLREVPYTSELCDFARAHAAEVAKLDGVFLSAPLQNLAQWRETLAVCDAVRTVNPRAMLVGHLRPDLYSVRGMHGADERGAPSWVGYRPDLAAASVPALGMSFASAANQLENLGWHIASNDTQIWPQNPYQVVCADGKIYAGAELMDISDAGWRVDHAGFAARTREFYGLAALRPEWKGQYYTPGQRRSVLPVFGGYDHDHREAATPGKVRSLAAWLRNGWTGWPEWQGKTGWIWDFPNVTWQEWIGACLDYAVQAGQRGTPVWYDFPTTAVWRNTHLSWSIDKEKFGYDYSQNKMSADNINARRAQAIDRTVNILLACRALPAGSVIVIPESVENAWGLSDRDCIAIFEAEDFRGQGKYLLRELADGSCELLQDPR